MPDIMVSYLKSRTLKYEEYFPLSRKSSIGIGSRARYYIEPLNAVEFVDLLRFMRSSGALYRVVGHLTNMLFCGEVYEGVIVSTKNLTRKSVAEYNLTAECGCAMPALVRYAASLGLGGIEPLGTIPGSVGGCVAGNAGAFGVECSDALKLANVYFPNTDEIRILSKSELCFSYRYSMLKACDAQMISATFNLKPDTETAILSRIDGIVKRRAATQPTGERSLGSVFKRVGNVGAGYYIENVGLKGYSIGGAQVSVKHAGFIVNRGGATSDDVLKLIDLIKSRVLLQFGVTLEEEIEIIS